MKGIRVPRQEDMTAPWKKFKIRLLIGCFLLLLMLVFSIAGIVIQEKLGRFDRVQRGLLISTLAMATLQYFLLAFVYITAKKSFGITKQGVPTRPSWKAMIILWVAILAFLAETIVFFATGMADNNPTGNYRPWLSTEQQDVLKRVLLGMRLAAILPILPYMWLLWNMVWWLNWVGQVADANARRLGDSQPLQQKDAEMGHGEPSERS